MDLISNEKQFVTTEECFHVSISKYIVIVTHVFSIMKTLVRKKKGEK